jgi:hypothetical protein
MKLSHVAFAALLLIMPTISRDAVSQHTTAVVPLDNSVLVDLPQSTTKGGLVARMSRLEVDEFRHIQYGKQLEGEAVVDLIGLKVPEYIGNSGSKFIAFLDSASQENHKLAKESYGYYVILKNSSRQLDVGADYRGYLDGFRARGEALLHDGFLREARPLEFKLTVINTDPPYRRSVIDANDGVLTGLDRTLLVDIGLIEKEKDVACEPEDITGFLVSMKNNSEDEVSSNKNESRYLHSFSVFAVYVCPDGGRPRAYAIFKMNSWGTGAPKVTYTVTARPLLHRR